MKRIIGLILVICLGLGFAGCAMKYPYENRTMTNIQLDSNQYEILSDKEVSGKASIVQFLFFIGGSRGYQDAYNDALSKYPGANLLVNVKIDYKSAFFLFGSSETTIVSGFPARVKVSSSRQ